MVEFVGRLTSRRIPFDPVSEPDGSTLYTLAQVKAAFWAVFHLSGEIWFGYQGTDEENTEHTQEWWRDFVEELDKAKGENDA